jgi:FHA domain
VTTTAAFRLSVYLIRHHLHIDYAGQLAVVSTDSPFFCECTRFTCIFGCNVNAFDPTGLIPIHPGGNAGEHIQPYHTAVLLNPSSCQPAKGVKPGKEKLEFYVVDLDSDSGTFVNGQRISSGMTPYTACRTRKSP